MTEPRDSEVVASISVLGDIFIDTVVKPAVDTEGWERPSLVIQTLGGFGANVCRWACALGVRTNLVGSVGVADLSWVQNQLASCCSVEGLTGCSLRTGICVSIVSDDGERQLFYERGANDMDRTQELSTVLGRLNPKVFSLYSFNEFQGDMLIRERSQHAEASAHNPPLLLDLGSTHSVTLSPNLEVLIPQLSILKGNVSEWRVLLNRDGLQEALTRSDVTMVATRGRLGLMARDPRGTSWCVRPRFSVRSPDTTGAGDASLAGLLSALDGRSDLPTASARAVAAGAVSVGFVGPYPHAPCVEVAAMVNEALSNVQVDPLGHMSITEFLQRAAEH